MRSTGDNETILVLGLGNDLVGDDGVGIHLVRRLRNLGWGEDIIFEESAAGGIALLEIAAGYNKLLLLDCIVAGDDNLGTVLVLSQEDLTLSRHASSIHDLSVSEVWELGKRMGLQMPKVMAVAIVVKLQWVIGERLSKSASNAIPLALEQCINILAGWNLKPHSK